MNDQANRRRRIRKGPAGPLRPHLRSARGEKEMAAPAQSVDRVYQDTLTNYLISMARTVEFTVNRSMEALLTYHTPEATQAASEIFLTEPRINEMEIIIDEHAVRMLRAGSLSDAEIRLVVGTLRINNDLERMGDLAVNIAQRVLSLSQMHGLAMPPELQPMTVAVRAMVQKSLGALIFRNATLASEVLESDDAVDHFRDVVCERLLASMTDDPVQIPPGIQFVLASRYLERIADHCTNIAEDVVYWVRGLDVRHGRGKELNTQELTRDDEPATR
jgi:phosphate transport system protein